MKDIAKRGLSLLLAIVLCIGILPGMTFHGAAATVDYQTGSLSGYSNVIKNWGSRETEATFLSPNAEAFYVDNNTSYSELSQLSGATSTSAVPSSDLYKELQNLMKSNHDEITSYNETKGMYRFTDCQNGNDSAISSFYSGVAIGPNWGSSPSWNREHTWPNSKGLGGSDENDIMMLRPTATSENSSRGNAAYGESSGYYHPNSESDGKYDLRGDVARITLYVYVRWGNTQRMWGKSGVMESKEVLLKWLVEDPVDTWELGRNDAVESITGTRNVFVDYPELAFLMFNEEIPTDMTTPSGEAADSGVSQYSITATANNSEYGTVSVSGRTITAVPAEGYLVSGYTLVSGTAEVKQKGNTFTVNASSDCTILVNFEARKAVEVSFMENWVSVSSQSVYTGESITLPSAFTKVPDGYTFLGWVTKASMFEETTTEPSDIYRSGASYELTAPVTFHALYSRIDSEGTGTSNVFSRYSGSLTEGDYLVTYSYQDTVGAMKAEVSNSRLSYSNVEVENDTIKDPDADLVWHIAPTSDGYWTICNESGGYAAGTGTKNRAQLLASATSYAKWTPSGDGVYEFSNLGRKAETNKYLRRNGTYGFACYGTGTGGAVTLYKRISGTVYYTTSTGAVCDHKWVDATCTVPKTCSVCGATEGTALGHKWADATCTAPKTCSVCGATEGTALGHKWSNATCDKPKTCSACGTTEGEALGHKWTGATCTAPKACGVCGATEGAALGHTYTNDQDDTCNRCGMKRGEVVKTVPMYRLYNPYSGEHFYTGSLEERDMLVTAGWTYEGIAWNAPVSTGVPVYRLYNPNSGDHHYTMSAEEKDMLVSVGWVYEGVAWNSAPVGNVPQYRLYNPNADCGSHHYTSSTEERDNLVALGWIYEGIGWFGMLK